MKKRTCQDVIPTWEDYYQFYPDKTRRSGARYLLSPLMATKRRVLKLKDIRFFAYFYVLLAFYNFSRGNKCQLMARSLLREVSEPAVFGFDQWVAKDTLEMFGCEK